VNVVGKSPGSRRCTGPVRNTVAGIDRCMRRIYVRDSGLLHQLLGLDPEKALLSHPKVGASWEGFVIEPLAALVTAGSLFTPETE
jgi:predicted AAA+ superfamily ATPase